jgi:hypothetical protein
MEGRIKFGKVWRQGAFGLEKKPVGGLGIKSEKNKS